MRFMNLFARFASSTLFVVASFGCAHDPDVVFENGADTSPDATTGSDTSAGTDTGSDAADASPCKDGCDDNDPCTDDTCNNGNCVHKPASGYTCDDGKACTEGDTCSNGQCFGTVKSCKDGDACTADACNPATGKCANTPISGCTQEQPECVSNSDCNDGNQCTDDLCVMNACEYIPDNGNTCITGSLCTSGDKCFNGQCIGTAVDCTDNNPCTADECDNYKGCTHPHVPYLWACEDGNLCTINDVCVAGKCETAPKKCDDNNNCTADSCNPANGTCSFNPIAGCGQPTGCSIYTNCDDGNVCTKDSCNVGTGKCQHVVGSCDDNWSCTADSCHEKLGCVNELIPNCGQPVSCPNGCNDANVCTTDSCNNGNCVFTPIPGCGTSQPEVPLTITWTKNAAAQATIDVKGVDTLGLMFECHQAGNGQLSEVVQIEWDVHAEVSATASSISKTFPKTKALSKCKANVVGKKSGSIAVWFARGGPKAIEGTLGYTWDGISVPSVGFSSNGQGGYDWKFAPGADSDGDGIPDTTDPAKFVPAAQ